MNLRARLLAFGTLLLTGCTAIIGVKDIFLDDSAIDNEGGSSSGSSGSSGTMSSGGPGGDATLDGASCGDTVGSADNCGRCGHSCLGGECKSSVCQPITLLNGSGMPRDFALDDTYAYVTGYGDGTIKKVLKTDGGTPVTVVGAWDSVTGIAVAGGKLYWTAENGAGNGTVPPATGSDYGGVWSCSLPGCTDKKQLQKVSLGYRVFEKNGVIYSASNDGIGRVYADGGAAAILNDDRTPNDVKADGTYVYYVSAYAASRALLDGGNPEDLGTVIDNFAGLVNIDDTHVFWTSQSGNNDAGQNAAGALKNGSGRVAYGKTNVAPLGIVSDNVNVYWTNEGGFDGFGTPNGSGQLLSCPVAGCPSTGPVLVVDKLLAPTVVQVEGDAIYFIEYGGTGNIGRLLKVAKP